MNTPTRLKKIEDKLNAKITNKRAIWPILGGLSTDPSVPHEPTRHLTPKEAGILQSKGVPVPICIALSREKEFQEYLKT